MCLRNCVRAGVLFSAALLLLAAPDAIARRYAPTVAALEDDSAAWVLVQFRPFKSGRQRVGQADMNLQPAAGGKRIVLGITFKRLTEEQVALVDGWSDAASVDNSTGFVFERIAPGRYMWAGYRLESEHARVSPSGGIEHVTTSADVSIEETFEVAAGQVVYLGLFSNRAVAIPRPEPKTLEELRQQQDDPGLLAVRIIDNVPAALAVLDSMEPGLADAARRRLVKAGYLERGTRAADLLNALRKLLEEEGATQKTTPAQDQTGDADRTTEAARRRTDAKATAPQGMSLVEAAYGQYDEVKRQLANGADINATNEWGKTALHVAANSGYGDIVELLLDSGADVNAHDRGGWTPLHSALSGDLEMTVLESLVARGANVEEPTPTGFTPLHFLAWRGNIAGLRLLFAHGAEVDAGKGTCHTGTPLHQASKHGHVEAIKLLLSKGATVDSKDQYGRTPLHLAAMKGHRDPVESLLACGAEVDARMTGKPQEYDDDKARPGWTSLHLAAANGHVDVAEALLARGADVNARGDDDKTPLRTAEEQNQHAVAEVLRGRGGIE